MRRFVLLLSVAACINAYADEWKDPATGYTWSYRIDGDTAEIYKESEIPGWRGAAAVSPSPKGDLTVPSSLGGKPVTRLGDDAFRECVALTGVTIPDGVASIGVAAFHGCRGLKSVKMSRSLTIIDRIAFSDCRCLKNITIPDSVTIIGKQAFFNCTSLVDLTIGSSVKDIGDQAFFNSPFLTSVVFKGDAPAIGKSAFFRGTNISYRRAIPYTFSLPEWNPTYKVVDGMWQGGKVEWWNPLAPIFETREDMRGPLTVALDADVFDCASAPVAPIDASTLDRQALRDVLGKLARGSEALAKSANAEEAVAGLAELEKSVSEYQKVTKISKEEMLNSYLCLLYTSIYWKMSNEDAKAKVRAEIQSLKSRATHGEEYFLLYSREVKLASLPRRPNSLVGLFSACQIPATWKKKSANATKKETESFNQAFIKSTAIPMLKAESTVINAAGKLVKSDSRAEAEKQLARIDAKVKELTRLSGQDVGRYAYSQQQKAMNASRIAAEHAKFLEEIGKMVDSPEVATAVKEKVAACAKAAAAASAKAQKLGVSAQSASRIGTGLYMVIDLSGGKDAKSYPVKYLNAEPKGGWTDEYKTTKLVLRRIKPGSFMMGSPANEQDRAKDDVAWNEIQHKVTITKPFYIGVFEITQKQYELVMGALPDNLCDNNERGDRFPVSHVQWNNIRGNSDMYNWPSVTDVDPASFMGMVREKTGIATLDLPTEAMWEYACRAGTTTAFNNGKNQPDTKSNNGKDQRLDNVAYYKVVGSYMANPWGLYDMHGNVSEMCLDWLEAMTHAAASDPIGAARSSYILTAWGARRKSGRVIRGGAIGSGAVAMRSALRKSVDPDESSRSWGFRLCCFTELPAKAKAFGNVLADKEETEIVNGWTLSYKRQGETAEIVRASYSGSRGSFAIPATLGGAPVESIGKGAFNGCKNLTGVIIPEGVTYIGECAFGNCVGLASVKLPDSLTDIGFSAFDGCGLRELEIPGSVKHMDNYAFAHCYGLESVVICKPVDKIGAFAFNDCRSLSSVTIPPTVKSIGQDAFYCCTSLESVEIPAGVTSIGWQAFRGCSKLESVHFMGDAPGCSLGWTFNEVPAGCKAYVFQDARGFKADASGKWNGLMVVRQKEKKP